MSQDELAAILDIPTDALRRQESGELFIGAAELHDLGKALGVGAGYFFRHVLEWVEGAPPPPDLAPPDADWPDAAFLTALLRVFVRMARAEGLPRVEYYLACAAEEMRQAGRKAKG